MPRTKSTLFSQAGTFVQRITTRVPFSGSFRIPTDLPYVAVDISVQLTTAIKLGVGNTLDLNIFNANNDAFIAGIRWTSYGPNGLTITNPDGSGAIVNPDPSVNIALNGRLGLPIYVTYLVSGIPSGTVVVTGLS